MSHYSNVPLGMYTPSFARLSHSAQALEYWLRHNGGRNTEGLFPFGFGAVEDAIGLTRDESEEAITALEEAGRPFVFDHDTGLVLDLDALRNNPLAMGRDKNGNPAPDLRMKGAVQQLKKLPNEARPLMRHLLANADRYSPDFAEAIRGQFPDLEDMSRDDLTPSPEAPYQAPTKPLTKPLRSPGVGVRVGDGDGVGGGDGAGVGDGEGEEPPGTLDRNFLNQVAGLGSS